MLPQPRVIQLDHRKVMNCPSRIGYGCLCNPLLGFEVGFHPEKRTLVVVETRYVKKKKRTALVSSAQGKGR